MEIRNRKLYFTSPECFRQLRSTYDYLTSVNSEICNAFVNKHHLLLIALDIEKDYEMTSREEVLSDLLENNVSGNLLKFIDNFWSKRRIRVRINDNLSVSTALENGLPQGSVVSTLLFICVINRIIPLIKLPVKVALFADDIALMYSGKNINTSMEIMQEFLSIIQNCAKNKRLKFSRTKTEYIVFSKKESSVKNCTLTLDGHKLNRTDKIKLLGMKFGSKYT